MRYNIFDVIAGCIIPFGILLAFVDLSVGITLLGIVGGYLVLKCLHRKYCESKIKQLPQNSLPIISLDPNYIIEEKFKFN